MKKYLSILALTALAASAMAQGTISFQNSAATAVKVGTSPSDPSATSMAANGGYVQLVWAPAGTAPTAWNGSTLGAWLAANTGWSVLDISKKIVNPAGRFLGGGITVPTSTPGATIQAAVIGWTGTAASFDEALADPTQKVGFSSIFTVKTGNPNATPIPDLPASIVTAGFGGVTVSPIPEPTSFALAGLGAAALLIFRRRK